MTDAVAARSNVYTLSISRPVPPGVRCHYCPDYATTKDHVVPKGRGGLNASWNLVPSCETCNLAKSSTVPTCRCEFCVRAVAGYLAGKRGGTSKSIRAFVRLRKGVWVVTTPNLPDKATRATFRTLKAAQKHAWRKFNEELAVASQFL